MVIFTLRCHQTWLENGPLIGDVPIDLIGFHGDITLRCHQTWLENGPFIGDVPIDLMGFDGDLSSGNQTWQWNMDDW